ncbi:MAG: sulfotransferase [Pseudomonadales bacterium]
MSLQTNDGMKHAFNEAVQLMKQSAFREARSFIDSSLKKYPNDPNLLRLLGVALTKLDHLGDAERHLTHAIRLVPHFSLAHENLAEVLLLQGKVDNAVHSLKIALQHNPDNEQATHKLRELLALLGRGREADELYQSSIKNAPDRQAMVEAMELTRAGDTTKAEKIYRDLLRANPENVDALRLMGVLSVKKDHYNDAEAYFKRAVELAPDFLIAWINLGTALNEQQKFGAAEDAYRQALAINPGSVHTLEKLGANCMNDDRLDDAVAWLNKALAIDEHHFPSLLCLGHALKTVGRQEEAIEAYRKCAASKADFGEVYWSLANLKTFDFEDEEVEEMQQQLDEVSQQTSGEDSAISFSFALGKAYEDRKDYKVAFKYYSRGNEKKRLKTNYDPIEFEMTVDRVINVFSKEYFQSFQDQGHNDDSPILIVGLPRSGSTLLEQVLASHSEVEGTAELHYLLRGATETGLNRVDGIKYPECMLELEPHQVAGLGQEYIEHTERHRAGATYFTDKMPNNFTGIGFLHAILPNAKVIDARRHPLDSCLGAFKQLFARGQVFSYDLYDLAHYYIQYIKIMEHWDSVLPGKVLRVNYEDVVENLEHEARKIAAHCGLAWEDQMLRYHETKRAVKTASSEQVRQPIYKGSLQLWRRYEDDLAELIDYLEPALLKLPEEQRPKSLVGL